MAGCTPYFAIPLQTRCDAVNGDQTREAARERMMATCQRIRGQIIGSNGFARVFTGDAARLVVLPEYFLTGFPMGESVSAWRDKAAIDKDGPEYAALSALAVDAQIYLSGNAYERDPHFPALYFQTSFIIDPLGEVILRYRRLQSLYAPTPYDVWDKYLDLYGLDGVFPVARTAIGVLACVASEEILYPEITRCLAMRGAEVICHSTSEISSPRQTKKDIARIARAQENLVYVVSANTAGIDNCPVPFASSDGKSQVVDFKGSVLAEAAQGESMAGLAEIDIEALRRVRRRPSMNNTLARQRFGLFADSYAGHIHEPANRFLGDDGTATEPSREDFMAGQRATIEALVKKGVLS